ncbi:extracellular solute-binding protein [Lichenihabitans psoromatis]|uniref:extracellular solute-binding protein n=1 Tax=Lichenihabitans psoromatis TaxID=2528642 RepID=UPI0010384813|nr:extracellular solute-binding protein [Lichenihabitans psoromatis]
MSTATIQLRGMTWDHPRGYDPLVACAAQWQRHTNVSVTWDRRSLQDFESYPVKTLAEQYDLIVIDHPHVGQIVAESCLAPLDGAGRDAELEALAQGSVGASFASYRWDGHLWALPIDAATQVQVWQPERIDRPVARWRDMLDLAAQGRVMIPMRAPHNLMTFYTLLGQLGTPARVHGPDLVPIEEGVRAYDLIAALVRHVDPGCYGMDPIATFEDMAKASSRVACIPLAYGYVSYARADFRPVRLHFADIPRLDKDTPVGSALGGTGIAVSAFSKYRQAALDFAYWVASGDVQRDLYAANGGQAGHAAAWEDAAVNMPVADFYRATRATLEGAWVRPRHDGAMLFQQAAADRLNAGLRTNEPGASVVGDINALLRRSFGTA